MLFLLGPSDALLAHVQVNLPCATLMHRDGEPDLKTKLSGAWRNRWMLTLVVTGAAGALRALSATDLQWVSFQSINCFYRMCVGLFCPSRGVTRKLMAFAKDCAVLVLTTEMTLK